MAQIGQLSLGQRLSFLAGLAAIVIAVGTVLYMGTQPDLHVLFSNLSPQDAGSIVDKLRDSKVPYALGNSGTTVLVPGDQVHDLRLQLAGEGLPHGSGVGFEIFDRTSIGVSEFTQKLNYRRALQGELARTIAQLPEVERARVHLAVPERRLFGSKDEDHPRASVVVMMRQQGILNKRQIQGIVHLVASSVEGLRPQDVTIVDGIGQLLTSSARDSSGPAVLSSNQLEYQQSLEKDVEARIQNMLEKIVGPHKVTVMVSSVVDFRQVELTEEKFDPAGQVVRSEERQQEKSSGKNSSGGAGGEPGAATNLPKAKTALPGMPGESSATESATKKETVNYDISRTVSRIIEPTGTLKRLSVAVMIDGTYETAKAGGERKYVPRAPEELKRFEDIVKRAMGYQEERGDQVKVENLQFGLETIEEGPAAGSEPAPVPFAMVWGPYIKYGIAALFTLLALVLVVRPLIAVMGSPQGGNGMPPALPVLPTLPAPVPDVELLLAQQQAQSVSELARQDPEQAAGVVKNWLKA